MRLNFLDEFLIALRSAPKRDFHDSLSFPAGFMIPAIAAVSLSQRERSESDCVYRLWSGDKRAIWDQSPKLSIPQRSSPCARGGEALDKASLFHFQDFAGVGADGFAERVAVPRPPLKCLEDQHAQGALQNFGGVLVAWFHSM